MQYSSIKDRLVQVDCNHGNSCQFRFLWPPCGYIPSSAVLLIFSKIHPYDLSWINIDLPIKIAKKSMTLLSWSLGARVAHHSKTLLSWSLGARVAHHSKTLLSWSLSARVAHHRQFGYINVYLSYIWWHHQSPIDCTRKWMNGWRVSWAGRDL